MKKMINTLLLLQLFVAGATAQTWCGGWCGCTSKTAQSPIAISNFSVSTSAPSWSFNFSGILTPSSTIYWENITNPVEIDYTTPSGSHNWAALYTGGALTFNASLHQVHMHIPSEHTLNGVTYGFEIHYVFNDPTNGSNNIVVAVLGNFNSPPAAGDTMTPNIVNDFMWASANVGSMVSNQVLPKGGSFANYISSGMLNKYYTYQGNTTTGSCTTAVYWLVCATPSGVPLPPSYPNGYVSKGYILNARPVQNMYNSNPVYYVSQ